MAQVIIKAKCKGVTRLLKTLQEVLYEDFCELLRKNFGISECQLQYKDEEGDLIYLGSQVELEEAFKVAERFSPLKLIIHTSETPNMDPCYQVSQSNQLPASSTSSLLLSQSTSSGQNSVTVSSTGSSTSSTSLSNSMGSLQLNETSAKEKNTKRRGNPKTSRKRVGFYASLCNDVNALDLSSSNNESSQSSQNEKPKKKQKHHGSGNYYSSLAEDVAAMRILERSEEKKEKPCTLIVESGESAARATSTNVVEKLQKDGPPECLSMNELEVSTREMSLQEDQPAPRLNHADIKEMGLIISSEVVKVLKGNANVPTTNDKPTSQGIKRNYATCTHDGILCDACHQAIIGPRYKCGNCADYDLCEQCESIEGVHNSSHVFVKLRYPDIGIGRKHGVMIPLLKDFIYKSNNAEQAEDQERTMKEVRKKLKQLAKKKREEQVRLKKGERKMKKFKGISHSEQDFNLIFLGDGSHPDGTEVLPNIEFTKIWKVKNGGDLPWDSRTQLLCRYGAMRFISHDVELPHLQSGEEGTVSVQFIAPTEPGEYTSVWRASHDGRSFGNQMWCKIIVVAEKSDDDDETFVDADESLFPTGTVTTPQPLGAATLKVQPRNTEESEGTEESDDIEESVEIKEKATDVSTSLPVSSDSDMTSNVSEESTNNVAERADVSLSLGDCELEWDTCLMDNDSVDLNGSNDEDFADIELISNASSDDYCVVPLPACFNPDIPLNIADNHLPDETPQTSTDPLIDELREKNLMQFSNTDPLPPTSIIPVVNNAESTRDTTALYVDNPTTEDKPTRSFSSSLPIRTPISRIVAPQPPSLERSAHAPGRLPPSPPGRAVPVFQTTNLYPEIPMRTAMSLPPRPPVNTLPSYDPSAGTEVETVRVQPPEPVVVHVSTPETIVTSQPLADVTVTVPAQSTAQFASTLVSGTLATAKRAIGTVTGTVTTLINGQVSGVSYNQGDETVHIISTTTEPVQPRGAPPVSEMERLIEMGFCDRALNERLLKKHNNDVNQVVTTLVHDSDNNWTQGRHVSQLQ